MLQVFPFFDFRRPCVAGHAEWGDHQDAVGLKAVEQEVCDGSQGDDRLAKTHIEQDCSYGMCFDVVDGIGLIIMGREVHEASLQSFLRCR